MLRSVATGNPQIAEAELQLRPADARVFRALSDSAQARPDTFLSMKEIADLAFETNQTRDTLQIKNLVQRSVYEIRQKLGREIIANRGSTYRLVPSELAIGSSTRPSLERISKPASRSFPHRVSRVLALAEESQTLDRLVFFGRDSVLSLREHATELRNLLSSLKTVRIVCADARQAVDLVADMAFSDGDDAGRFLKNSSEYLQILVSSCPGSSGFGWIDQRQDGCFVEIANLFGESINIGGDFAARNFFEHYDQRWAMLEAQEAGSRPIIVIDSLDAIINRQSATIGGYALHRFRSDSEPDITPLLAHF